MANIMLAKCLNNIVFKLISRLPPTSGVLLAASKNFGSSARSYSRSLGTCQHSEQELKCNRANTNGKKSNVTERILRFLKADPEKVIQKMKKELNTIPTALKIGSGLYDARPFKCNTLRKPSSLFRYTAQNTKLSAKGIRHQFNFPEKEPHILDLIKQDLIIPKNSGNKIRSKAVGCEL